MNYFDLIKPRNVDEKGAGLIVGKMALFRRMVESKWIAAVVSGHACVLYAVGHVHACCDLLEEGYLPGTKEPSKVVIQAAQAGKLRPAYLTA